MLDYIQKESIRKQYEGIIEQITDGLDFLQVINANNMDSLKSVEFFTSHEGLLLNYEEALTELVKGKRDGRLQECLYLFLMNI